ncbi:MAG: hypothetical protein KA533_03420 [Sphingobium sp.]|nr:hypothetical protein [Sphingobium sp.]MBP6111532.1 hypothetical protein [Sphingobium sp.]MBP8670539.1 hypothetical protein [Sphingobium sp.]MBP9157264.1 hypothetical protein [Sphingobium sp.]MCC6482778.1 hypothetical protein [Sphingomonadaceae bacterium]
MEVAAVPLGFEPFDIGIDRRTDPFADRRFAFQIFDVELIIEIIGEFERLMLIACLGAAVDIALGTRNLDPAEPCGLFEVRPFVEIDQSVAESLALYDRPLGRRIVLFSDHCH